MRALPSYRFVLIDMGSGVDFDWMVRCMGSGAELAVALAMYDDVAANHGKPLVSPVKAHMLTAIPISFYISDKKLVAGRFLDVSTMAFNVAESAFNRVVISGGRGTRAVHYR